MTGPRIQVCRVDTDDGRSRFTWRVIDGLQVILKGDIDQWWYDTKAEAVHAARDAIADRERWLAHDPHPYGWHDINPRTVTDND